MKTMKHYAFTPKPSNRAKYGADAPRDGYINSWTEEIPLGMSDQDAEDWSEEMRQTAHQQAKDWLGYDL